MKRTPKLDPTPSKFSRSSSLALGAVTLLASGVFRQGLGVVTLAVTARMLRPEDFGIIAYFLIFVALLEMIQRQISMVLIRLDAVSNEHIQTVFTLQVLFGVLAAGLIWASAPVMALFGIPELVEILPAVSAISLLIALRNPRFLLYERGLRFSLAAAEETLNRMVYAAVAIYLAWLWRDFWAIVVATFAGIAMRNLWTFITAPMTPKLSLSRWRDSLAFSSWAIGAQLSQFFANSVPQILIGAALGLADAGIFRVGSRIIDTMTTQLFAPLQRVIYPGLADLARSSDRKKEAFITLNALLLTIVLPLSIGSALIAEDAILFGLGFKWIAAAQVIWVLAPFKALETLQANVRAASYIEGSTQSLFMRNALLLVLVCLFMWVGTQFGFNGALAAVALSSFAALVITLILAKAFGNGGLFEPLTVAWRSFAACALMVAAVIAADQIMRSGEDVPRLLVIVSAKVGVGAVVYTTTHIALWRWTGRPEGLETLLLSLTSRLRGRWARKRP
ncbi:oligosaccharide flippase family protein [Roseovarius arcticus]|uniref:oligosaccharide flippase family protein n=1 Tax=Roseovarius arcticus TaxID=2547404 RepID=UPI00111002F1|nr:oligosaccharide flippase family protein [Roseovarius arcticus]